MRAIFTFLATLIANNNKSWIAQILTGAGLGLASFAALTMFVDYYKSKALDSFGALGSVTGILGLAGVDKAISILIGAYLASVYIKTFASSLKIVKK
jgi:uncharacterized BrkB/YihY/UPF0761 family membrane protein